MQPLKLLVVSDDINQFTGVGLQLKQILFGLQATGNYEITLLAGSSKSQTPSTLNSIQIYPAVKGYGSPAELRYIMKKHNPDIVMAFSDPRYFEWLFRMDDEIRSTAKLILYSTWDNGPFPEFNRVWYDSCDEVVVFTNFAADLLNEGGIDCKLIAHGYDTEVFHKLPDEEILDYRSQFIKQAGFKEDEEVFIIFWNNRNIHRKRPGDVIEAFKLFHEKHPNSFLLIHTDPIDMHGINIPYLIDHVMGDIPVVISSKKIPPEKLNVYYNVADITLNIAFSEGFGLCVGESFLTETPVIMTRTGGMPEQAHKDYDKTEFILTPAVSSLFGTLEQPFIYRDFVDVQEVVDALLMALDDEIMDDLLDRKKCREHVVNHFNIRDTVRKFDKLLQKVDKYTKKRKPWELVQC